MQMKDPSREKTFLLVKREDRKLTPEDIARWRYQQIDRALPVLLNRSARARLIKEISKTPVVWPSGAVKPIKVATLYRWMSSYQKSGLSGLEPKSRKDKGTTKARLPEAVIQAAEKLWLEDPEISLTFAIGVLLADPELDLVNQGIKISRSTLHRRLAAQPFYRGVIQGRKRERHRLRYLGRHAHDIWRLDAKGPVKVRLTSRQTIEIHIMTVLDDVTRAVLAALVVLSPDLFSAVAAFRKAAKRYGLPRRVYADRARIFDSKAFREGLAPLGVHRIWVRGRNPSGNGKIEAYHRSLKRWFTDRLAKQEVVDLIHLQQLLDGMIEKLYQDHHHRGMKQTPRAALAGQESKRTVSGQRLDDAFKKEVRKKSHPKTGEVDFESGTYLVPEPYRGQKLLFLIDPDPRIEPLFVEPQTKQRRLLKRAAIALGPETEEKPVVVRWGKGPLQVLYDSWQKQVRPNAEAGFGLPELYSLLTSISGRHVPASDSEAREIHMAYQELGPLPSSSLTGVLKGIGSRLGKGRPIRVYLSAMAEAVNKEKNP